MKGRLLLLVYWLLVGAFVTQVLVIFVEPVQDLFRGEAIFGLWLLIFGLGVVMSWLTYKRKTKGWLSRFLMMTGLSAVGFLVGVVGHNLAYAGAELSKEVWLLHGFFEVMHVGLFLIALVMCPVTFLVGMVGSLLLVLKKNLKLES